MACALNMKLSTRAGGKPQGFIFLSENERRFYYVYEKQ